MKKIFFLRGCPKVGKTSFLKKHGLEDYAISINKTKKLCFDIDYDKDLGFDCLKDNDSKEDKNFIFNLYNQILEKRLEKGVLTFVDNLNLSDQEIYMYCKKALNHGYKVFVIDFSDIALDVVLHRNKETSTRKYEEYRLIELYNQSQQRIKLPDCVKIIKPEQFLDHIQFNIKDLSGYKKIIHIGDIHGCFEPLSKLFSEGIDPYTFYIFHGDYLNRGIQNHKVLRFLLQYRNHPQFIFIEGNHENHLRSWIDNNYITTNFRATYEEVGYMDKKTIKSFIKKLHPYFVYTYNERTILCSHGGIDQYNQSMALLNDSSFIRGVGGYDQNIDAVFESYHKDSSIYQVHGHRNKGLECDIDSYQHSFNLEGSVDKGKYLRCLIHSAEGFEPVYIKNNVFKERES